LRKLKKDKNSFQKKKHEMPEVKKIHTKRIEEDEYEEF